MKTERLRQQTKNVATAQAINNEDSKARRADAGAKREAGAKAVQLWNFEVYRDCLAGTVNDSPAQRGRSDLNTDRAVFLNCLHALRQSQPRMCTLSRAVPQEGWGLQACTVEKSLQRIAQCCGSWHAFLNSWLFEVVS